MTLRSNRKPEGSVQIKRRQSKYVRELDVTEFCDSVHMSGVGWGLGLWAVCLGERVSVPRRRLKQMLCPGRHTMLSLESCSVTPGSLS